MVSSPCIHGVRFTRARGDADGLIGYISCRLGDTLVVDGIAVRRALDGRIILAFPERRDAAGRVHPIVRPLDQGARDAVTEQVVAELKRQEVLP